MIITQFLYMASGKIQVLGKEAGVGSGLTW